MRFQRVCLESFGYFLPGEVVSSEQIEGWLAPLYDRIGLSAGRLELMTGIRERRLWQPRLKPSEASTQCVRRAMDAANIDPSRIGALIHASVCRDHLEPATSCLVHRSVGLRDDCLLYDVSNACLGFLNAMLQVATLIEMGEIEAGIVVSSEGSRGLLESTIRSLNANTSLTRKTIKDSVASLTIGSASVAAVLTHESISHSGNRLVGGHWMSDTSGNHLCRSCDETAGGEHPLMETDSEALMQAGVALGERAFEPFLAKLGWTRETLRRTVCHQVGLGHRKLMLQTLGLDAEADYTSVQWLGNTGSAAAPITLALAAERDFVASGDSVALLGIGSGINTVMLGIEWQTSLVLGDEEPPHPDSTARRIADPVLPVA
jgi:3-oxoacyl-[acyl-carrier-protein] synthase-3